MRFFREYGAQAQADRNDGDANMVNQARVAEGSFSNVQPGAVLHGRDPLELHGLCPGLCRRTALFRESSPIDRIPKFLYYFYQSQRPPDLINPLYAGGPMVYIANYWTPESPKDGHCLLQLP